MDIEQARLNMIEQQIRTWEVLDQNVLHLLNEIHREEFMPPAYKGLAFADTGIPIGHGQTTMSPKVEARILQSLALQKHETVLEIGTGCGYLTCLLASNAKQVTSIDIFPDLIASAKNNIERNHIDNIELESVDAFALLDRSDQYDVIVFTASLPTLHDEFLKLLNDNGRLFVIIGNSPAMEARIITKQTESSYSTEGLFETDLPALLGAKHKERFSF